MLKRRRPVAIEPHVHSYRLHVTILFGKEPTYTALCNHPECDHELDGGGILSYLNWVEKYKDGLKQIGADF
jgi:hypothetical protein